MQSELKKYQRHIILKMLLTYLPIVLAVSLIFSCILLYFFGVIAAFIGVTTIVIVCALFVKIYFTKKIDNFLDFAKTLDSNFGDCDMIQTVMELNSPDDSIVQQELFEQAHLKLEPLYRKASISYIQETDKGKKVTGFAFVLFLILCVLTLFLNDYNKSSNKQKKSQSQGQQRSSQNGSSNENSDSLNLGKGDSKNGEGRGKSREKGGGKGKSKKGKSTKSSTSKAKMGDKPKVNPNQVKMKSSKSSSKLKPLTPSKNESPPSTKKKKPKSNKSAKKISPKKSEDWKKSYKGKWDKESKGKSIATGKMKAPLVDKRNFSTKEYLKSGNELITGVKKMTIPQKYKDKILNIYEAVRTSSKNSKDVLNTTKENK